MTDVRSQRLCHFQVPDTAQWVLWIGPTNTVTLLKGTVLYNWGGAAATATVTLQTPGGLTPLAAFNVASGTSVTWVGWVAVNPGDRVLGSSSSSSVDFVLFGAVLAGGPPYPPFNPEPALTDLPTPLPTVWGNSPHK